MITDAPVRLRGKKLTEGTELEVAPTAAGMAERVARTWASGPPSSQTKKARGWWTREDPLADVWESEVELLVVADDDGAFEGKAVFAALVRSHPDRFESGQDRTLLRRFPSGCGEHRVDQRRRFFRQAHLPTRTGATAFTHATQLG